MKATLLFVSLFLLSSALEAQTAPTGAVGFDGEVVHTTTIVKSSASVPSAAVRPVDAATAQRTWHSRLLSYAMQRKLTATWQTLVVEYR